LQSAFLLPAALFVATHLLSDSPHRLDVAEYHAPTIRAVSGSCKEYVACPQDGKKEIECYDWPHCDVFIHKILLNGCNSMMSEEELVGGLAKKLQQVQRYLSSLQNTPLSNP